MGCTYLANAPLLRLLRNMIREQTEHPAEGYAEPYVGKLLKLDASAYNLIHIIIEEQIIQIIQYASFIVQETTKGPKEDSKPRRTMINGRDVFTAVWVLKDCLPILRGGPRTVLSKKDITFPKGSTIHVSPPRRGRARSSQAGAGPKPRAKAKSSGKSKAKGKAKASGRAKAASRRR